MEIYLVRHTTPEIGTGICYGHSEIGLTNNFELEARHILAKIPQTIELVYTSPMFRCKALADFLAKAKVPIISDSRLKELNFGDWEMKAWDNIEPLQLMKWMNNYETERCPNGESYTDLVLRVKDFIKDMKQLDQGTVLIVTHGGVMKAFHALLNHVSLKAAMDFKIGYGEIILINLNAYNLE